MFSEGLGPIAPCPYWSLDQPSSQVILTSSKDHPLQIHYAFSPAGDGGQGVISNNNNPSTRPLASYNLINDMTEAYFPVASLFWSAPGTHFIAGTEHRIALFDVSRPDVIQNKEPVATVYTSRRVGRRSFIGMRGTISAMALHSRHSADMGLVAAGTWSRSIGLFDLGRAGECATYWSLAGGTGTTEGYAGNGVMQTLWSPCGRYLVVNERNSTGLLVYDVRGNYRLLAHLRGRSGPTSQRLTCDVYAPSSENPDGSGGFEVWSGTGDGGLVCWEGVGKQEGDVDPSWRKEIHGRGSAVSGTMMHTTGSILATCSGSWRIRDDDEEEDSSSQSGSDTDESDTDGSDGSASLESGADASEEDHSDKESSSDSDSESESESESDCGITGVRLTRKQPRSPIFIEETSLKLWNIRSLSDGNEPQEG